MAKNRQKIMINRARKMARNAAKKKHVKHHSGGGISTHIGCSTAVLKQSPIHMASISNSIFEKGMGPVVISRKLPDGRIAAGMFLLDIYCLGVKNAFLFIKTPPEFDEAIEGFYGADNYRSVSPAYARKLIEGSVAYAEDLGFKPHRDYREAARILGDIDPEECTEEFVFGKNGKPLYIAGPNDSKAMARRIISQLQNKCGPDGAHYIVGIDDPAEVESLGPGGRIIGVENQT